MKAIKLTEERKSKLLEMCQVLFPKYKFGFGNDVADLGIMEYYKDDKEWFFIHWFEFCMCHIKSKINELNGIPNHKVLLASDNGILINHPVDYLYEQFKKLK